MQANLTAPQERTIHHRHGIGAAAHVLQGRELEILRIRVDQPALIFVDRGIKAVRTDRGATVRALPGQAIVLGANQTVDFTNSVTDGSRYEARWLVFEPALLDDPYYRDRCAGKEASLASLAAHGGGHLAGAFRHAGLALATSEIPDPVARQRMLEVLHWLAEHGIVLRSSTANLGVAAKVRALIGGRLDRTWSADGVAGALALSEATLRRRLAAESTSLTELLTDARMATALTLLQATTQPVADIALAVGYESPSRFAVRFRQRFGFSPTAVRGHERSI